MNEIPIVSRKSLQAEAKIKIARGEMGAIDRVDFARPVFNGNVVNMSQEERFRAIERMTPQSMIPTAITSKFSVTGKYGSGFDIPVMWSDGVEMSAREKLNTGFFNPQMASNTLPVDWQNLWDAMRVDVSVRKAALPTMREEIYNVTVNPAFTRTINPTEIMPFAVAFEENDGHGQAVTQGETLGGGYESITILIYAAGFTWDLMAELFDLTITPERLMDAVMVGYNALRDNIAFAPIIAFSYSGVQQTGPASLTGANRQELLYLTLDNALDDLGDRENPVTNRAIDVNEVKILAHPYDARHIARVAAGLPSTNERSYPGISEISKVLSYDTEVIKLKSKTVTYTGVTKGYAYMIIPASAIGNAYMEIAVKRDLVVETDMNPDVKTLTREQRAYWFAEAIWYEGIQYFIQEITLPSW